MRKNKIFIACDSTNIQKIKKIIKQTENKNIIFGYKFGLEFFFSKDGRKFISKIKNEDEKNISLKTSENFFKLFGN